MLASAVLVGLIASGPTVCWNDAPGPWFDSLVASAPNVRLVSDCPAARCRQARAWCLSWDPSGSALVLRSGTSVLRRELPFEAPDLEALVRAQGAMVVAVYLESLALQASLTKARPVPPRAPPPPTVTATVASPPSPPPPPPPPPRPRPLPWPEQALRPRATIGRQGPAPLPHRARVEAGVRFRSPGFNGPMLGLRYGLGPGFVRARGQLPVSAEADGVELRVWGLGLDAGWDWTFVRQLRLRFGGEVGLTGELIETTRLDSGEAGLGGAGGVFVGLWTYVRLGRKGGGPEPARAQPWGPVELGAFATGLGLPLVSTVQVEEGPELRVGRWGFRSGLQASLRF